MTFAECGPMVPPRQDYDLNIGRAQPRILALGQGVLPDPWLEFCLDYRIALYLVIAYENEVANQKIWAACGILARGIERGHHIGKKKIGDSSSGNFVLALAWAIAEIRRRWPAFPIENVVAVIPHSTPKEKKQILEAAGIELRFADNSLAAMELAGKLAEEENWWYTRQYWNLDNTASWAPFAESIAARLPFLGAFACGVGTGGSCSGNMMVLTRAFAERQTPARFLRVAVIVEDDEVEGIPVAVDGVRNRKALKPGTLPWWQYVDTTRYVNEERSRIASAALWRQNAMPGSNCIGGFSTGFALEGLMLALREQADLHTLDDLRDQDGFIHAACIAPDTRNPYRSKYAKHGIHFGR